MFAVIFKAEVKMADDAYWETAAKLRKLASESYGCLGLTTVQEGVHEVTISYWDTEEQIERWRRDPLHRQAQQIGKTRWYRHYTVEIAEVTRSYHSS